MQSDVQNGQFRLKTQALQLGAHAECLRGREHACNRCRDIVDGLIDRAGQTGRRSTTRANGARA